MLLLQDGGKHTTLDQLKRLKLTSYELFLSVQFPVKFFLIFLEAWTEFAP